MTAALLIPSPVGRSLPLSRLPAVITTTVRARAFHRRVPASRRRRRISCRPLSLQAPETQDQAVPRRVRSRTTGVCSSGRTRRIVAQTKLAPTVCQGSWEGCSIAMPGDSPSRFVSLSSHGFSECRTAPVPLCCAYMVLLLPQGVSLRQLIFVTLCIMTGPRSLTVFLLSQ